MKNEFSHRAGLDVVVVPLLNVNSSKRICSQRKKTDFSSGSGKFANS